MRESIPLYVREQVLQRDGYRCRYCGNTSGPFHMDHVYPCSKGGETSINNLVTACPLCNVKKHNKVGLWPKPVGYWDDMAGRDGREAELKEEARRTKPQFSVLIYLGVADLITAFFLRNVDGYFPWLVFAVGVLLSLAGMYIMFAGLDTVEREEETDG
jgi:hypothetical protein